MREAEFQSLVLDYLSTIRDNTKRIAEACERAERWTAHPDVTPANAAAVLLEPDPLTASTEAECGPLGGTVEPRASGRGKRRGRRG